MNTLVIYDSFFGNTKKIAQAIAKGLEAQAVPVGWANIEQLDSLNLLMVCQIN
jgi:flavodoxin